MSVRHAARAALLMEIARCAHNWEYLTSISYCLDADYPARMQEAEAALIRACVRLAAIPDCSD